MICCFCSTERKTVLFKGGTTRKERKRKKVMAAAAAAVEFQKRINYYHDSPLQWCLVQVRDSLKMSLQEVDTKLCIVNAFR